MGRHCFKPIEEWRLQLPVLPFRPSPRAGLGGKAALSSGRAGPAESLASIQFVVLPKAVTFRPKVQSLLVLSLCNIKPDVAAYDSPR